MISPEMKTQLTDYLFSFTSHHVYAIVDGAAVAGLPEALSKNEPEYCCLYSGPLSSEMAEVAPYLVKLEKGTPIYDCLLSSWGQSFGIIAIIPNTLSFKDVRKHFRSLLMIKNPKGASLYFRYYDPRTLHTFLPLCESEQIPLVFDKVKLYVLEGEDKTAVRRYWVEANQVASKESTFTAA